MHTPAFTILYTCSLARLESFTKHGSVLKIVCPDKLQAYHWFQFSPIPSLCWFLLLHINSESNNCTDKSFYNSQNHKGTSTTKQRPEARFNDCWKELSPFRISIQQTLTHLHPIVWYKMIIYTAGAQHSASMGRAEHQPPQWWEDRHPVALLWLISWFPAQALNLGESQEKLAGQMPGAVHSHIDQMRICPQFQGHHYNLTLHYLYGVVP